MASEDYTDKEKHEDVKILHGMGYAQELSRSMSKFSNFAISFSIICILSGGINSFAQAISSVGGAGAGIGWIVGCLLSGMFALHPAMPQLGAWDTELIEHWFHSFAGAAGITLHVENLYGSNNHHVVESCYKALARALRVAVEIDPRKADSIPSTKGML